MPEKEKMYYILQKDKTQLTVVSENTIWREAGNSHWLYT